MKILNINSSAQLNGSRSRQLTSALANKLKKLSGGTVVDRDLTQGLQFITEAMIDRYYIPKNELTEQDKAILGPSDKLVDELIESDVIIIGAPMYNFAIPGTLKSYLDQICRLGRTFTTNPEGFEGLLKNKIAYIIITTGGTPITGDDDFMTAYLTRILDFIGITDVRFLVVDKFQPKEAEKQMQEVINSINSLQLPLRSTPD